MSIDMGLSIVHCILILSECKDLQHRWIILFCLAPSPAEWINIFLWTIQCPKKYNMRLSWGDQNFYNLFIYLLVKLRDSFRSVNFKNSCRWPQPPLPRRNHLGWDGGSREWRPRCPSTLHRPLQKSLGPSQIWTGWYAAPKHIPAFWGSVCHDHDPMIISSISHCIVWHCC